MAESEQQTTPTPEEAPRPRRGALLGLLALSLASGVVSMWALAPIDRPWLIWLAPAGLWYALARCTTPRRAFWCAYLFGAAYNAQGLDFLRTGLGVIPWLPLALVVALFPAFTCELGWCASRRVSHTLRPVVWACAWVLGEAIRHRAWAIAHTLDDFGYALHATPVLLQTADLGGVLLLTWLIALWAAGLGEALAARGPGRWRPLLLPAAAWGLSALYGACWLARPEWGTPHWVAIAQPAGELPQFYEAGARQSTLLEEVETYGRLLDAANADGAELILLPESALGTNLDRLPWAAKALAPLTAERGAWLAAGFPEDLPRYPGAPAREADHFNGLGLFSPEGKLEGKYRKRHLVGFGEYLPFRQQLQGIYKHFPVRPYDVTPGAEVVTFDAGVIRFTQEICFETCYGFDVRRSLRTGGEAVAIHTNDGWFQNVQEAKLHGRAAQVRAVENRVTVLRSATTAYSGVIDSRGRWLSQVGIDEARAVVTEAWFHPPRSLYHALGDSVVLVPSLLTVLGLLVRRRPARAPNEPS